MLKKICTLLIISIFLLTNPVLVSAERGAAESCGPSYEDPNEPCIKDYCCELEPPTFNSYSCKYSPVCAAFGKVAAPSPLAGFLAKDPTGALAISDFLSRLIILIFSVAGIVLIFMLLWGAFDWMTSEGDKEKIAGAQRKIINAIIGIILFAVAFAAIRVLGEFTGFTLFKEPIKVFRDASGNIYRVVCSDGTPLGGPSARIADPAKWCKDNKH